MSIQNGERSNIEWQEISATATVAREDLASGSGEWLQTAIADLSQQVGRQMDADILDRLREAPPAIGRRFSASSAQEVADELLQSLDDMDVSFDDEEGPGMAIIASPQLAAQLEALKGDAEFARKLDDILARKRDDWVYRESHRRLVD